jgi:hypothetical protein
MAYQNNTQPYIDDGNRYGTAIPPTPGQFYQPPQGGTAIPPTPGQFYQDPNQQPPPADYSGRGREITGTQPVNQNQTGGANPTAQVPPGGFPGAA